MQAYLYERRELKLIVVLIDSRRGLQDEEFSLLEMDSDLLRLPVLTKTDKLSKSEREKALNKLSDELDIDKEDIFHTGLMGKNKTGVDGVRDAICELLVEY